MSQKEREDDDIEQKEDGKQEGESQDGGSSGIHKYFGKSNKSPKLLNFKSKKSYKFQDSQNLSIMTETNVGSQKDVSNAHQKTKLKFQYRWNSDILNTKPKIKLTFNPFLKEKLFQQALLNWKNVISKTQDESFDFKFNDKKALNMKYKKTQFYLQKKLRHRLQAESTIQSDLNVKNSLSFESLAKSTFFDTYEYLNSGQLKGKIGIRDWNYKTLGCNYKFDFSQKLTFLINKYKAKQESKVSLSFGQKQTAQFKSNFEVTNDKNVWTFYGAVYGYKWSLGFDEVKFIYSLPDIWKDWKVGCMYGQKNAWEVTVQNQKLNLPYCSSFAFSVGNKNWALNLKNKFSKKQYGRVNFELSLQSPLKNIQFEKINYGFVVNLNL